MACNTMTCIRVIIELQQSGDNLQRNRIIAYPQGNSVPYQANPFQMKSHSNNSFNDSGFQDLNLTNKCDSLNSLHFGKYGNCTQQSTHTLVTGGRNEIMGRPTSTSTPFGDHKGHFALPWLGNPHCQPPNNHQFMGVKPNYSTHTRFGDDSDPGFN
jgi:hypothetical protein